MDAFDVLEQHLHELRVRLAQETPAARSELGSFPVVGHSKVEKLAQIDAALMRLVEGRYGVCFACERTIAIERLRLVPATLFCLRCAHRRPRASRGVRKKPADSGLTFQVASRRRVARI